VPMRSWRSASARRNASAWGHASRSRSRPRSSRARFFSGPRSSRWARTSTRMARS
jgi:hypothetical protein